MKTKNLSFIDRHVHQIIVGIAVLFVALVAWFYVQGDPYVVELNGMPLQPGQIAERVAAKADEVSRAITKAESPLPKITVPSYTSEFKSSAVRSLVGKSRFDVPLGPPGLDPKVWGGTGPTELPDYLVAAPPPATSLTTHQGFGVLAFPAETEKAKAWHDILGGDVRDVRYVSVAGRFDMKEWRRRLADAPEKQRMPESWWRARLAVADVILERQTLDPRNNQWGPSERIGALPNAAFSFRRGDYGSDADETIRTIRVEQDQISKPPPPPLIDNAWVAPSAAAAPELDAEQQKKLSQLEAKITKQREEIKSAKARAAPAPAPARTPARAQPGETSGGRTEPAQPARTTARTDTAKANIDKLEAELQKMIAERDAMRGTKSAPAPTEIKPVVPPAIRGGEIRPPVVRGGEVRPGGGIAKPEAAPDEESDGIEVWAHDITVKPGHTYRYRIVVAVLDPLFQRREPKPEQREVYFEKLALESQPDQETAGEYKNAWSEPVTIERETYFYLASGNRAAQNAQVEVWRVVNGAWRSVEFTVQPGDPIGKPVVIEGANDGKPVDMSVNSVVVDIEYDAPADDQSFNQTTTRLLYMDRASGKVLSRTMTRDKDDQRRQKLKSQTVDAVAENR